MADNDLISRSALLEIGTARKIIEVVGNWNELPGIAKSACTRLGLAHRKMIIDAPAVDAVELPVLPGCTVWILNHKFPAEIVEICVRKDGMFAVWVEYDRGPELAELWDDGEFDIKEIGKTVFLTVGEWEKVMYPCEHCFCGSYRSCDGCDYPEQRNKRLALESAVDLDKQAKENNAAMRKVIDFITEDLL